MEPRAKLVQMCYERGMFQNQAETVVGLAIPQIDKFLKDEIGYKINWYDANGKFPEGLYATIFMFHVAPVALKWIDENIPKAWFRPLFDLNDPIHKTPSAGTEAIAA